MVEFENIDELFIRIYPCLRLKKRLLKARGFNISIKTMWSYLSETWKDSNNLTLYDMVNDIMILDVNDMKEV